MKTYKIPIRWELCSYIEVEAESAEEAIDIAVKEQDDYDLPSDGSYVDGSFEVETDIDYVKMENNEID